MVERFGRNMSGMVPDPDGKYVRYSDHEAELSALNKQVEELTKVLNRKVDEKCAAVQARTRAEAEVAALRKALEFYADVSKYPAPLTGGMGDLWADCGRIARSALAPTRETSDA